MGKKKGKTKKNIAVTVIKQPSKKKQSPSPKESSTQQSTKESLTKQLSTNKISSPKRNIINTSKNISSAPKKKTENEESIDIKEMIDTVEPNTLYGKSLDFNDNTNVVNPDNVLDIIQLDNSNLEEIKLDNIGNNLQNMDFDSIGTKIDDMMLNLKDTQLDNKGIDIEEIHKDNMGIDLEKMKSDILEEISLDSIGTKLEETKSKSDNCLEEVNLDNIGTILEETKSKSDNCLEEVNLDNIGTILEETKSKSDNCFEEVNLDNIGTKLNETKSDNCWEEVNLDNIGTSLEETKSNDILDSNNGLEELNLDNINESLDLEEIDGGGRKKKQLPVYDITPPSPHRNLPVYDDTSIASFDSPQSLLSSDNSDPPEYIPTSPPYAPNKSDLLGDNSDSPKYMPTSPSYAPNKEDLLVNKSEQQNRVIIKNSEYKGKIGYVIDNVYTYDFETKQTYGNVHIPELDKNIKLSTEDLVLYDSKSDINSDFIPPYQKNMIRRDINKDHILHKYIKLGGKSGDLKNLVGYVTEVNDDNFLIKPSHPALSSISEMKISFEEDDFVLVDKPDDNKVYNIDPTIFWMEMNHLDFELNINNCNDDINGKYTLWIPERSKSIKMSQKGKIVGIIDGPYYKNTKNDIVIMRNLRPDSFKKKEVLWYIMSYKTTLKQALYISTNIPESFIPPLTDWKNSHDKTQLKGKEPFPIIHKKKKIEIKKPEKPVHNIPNPMKQEDLDILKKFYKK